MNKIFTEKNKKQRDKTLLRAKGEMKPKTNVEISNSLIQYIVNNLRIPLADMNELVKEMKLDLRHTRTVKFLKFISLYHTFHISDAILIFLHKRRIKHENEVSNIAQFNRFLLDTVDHATIIKKIDKKTHDNGSKGLAEKIRNDYDWSKIREG